MTAACKLALSQASLTRFAAHPERYLDRFPSGGADLSFGVRRFASFNRFGLKAVAKMVQSANPLQKGAIGRGLAQAVNACIPRDGEVAKQIADVVRRSSDHLIVDAYLDAADDGASRSAPSPGADEPRKGTLSLDPNEKITTARPAIPAIALSPN